MLFIDNLELTINYLHNQRMRFVKIILLLFFISWVSCSTIDSDAKKAAELTEKSLTAIRQNKLKASQEYYNSYKKIENKYRNKGKLELKQFEETYWKYVYKKKDKL